MRSSHAGGSGQGPANRRPPRSRSSGSRVTSVPSSSATGPTTATNNPELIAATARPRCPPNKRCTRNMIGQVATTIIAAQTIADRNGRNTASTPHSSAATHASTMALPISCERRSFINSYGAIPVQRIRPSGLGSRDVRVGRAVSLCEIGRYTAGRRHQVEARIGRDILRRSARTNLQYQHIRR